MKTIKCEECIGEFKAETREAILGILYEHYMQDHNSIITGATTDEKKTWMLRFEKEWAEAKET